MNIRRLSSIFLALLAAPAGAWASTAGGAFEVAPLRMEFTADQQAAQMQLRNVLDQDSAVQVRVFTWTQAQGEDHYAPSDDFSVTPSIVQIGAHTTQLFHVVRRDGFTVGTEYRYRIVIDQLPVGPQQSAPMATTRLQITLPLFVGSESVAPAAISARIAGRSLLLTNAGGRAAQAARLTLTTADGRDWPINLKPGRYLFGGETKAYPLDPAFSCDAAHAARLSGIVDGRDYDSRIAQSCP